MVIEDVAKHMPADGSVTITNNTKYHNFFNGGEQDRIHLVIDLKPTEEMIKKLGIYKDDYSFVKKEWKNYTVWKEFNKNKKSNTLYISFSGLGINWKPTFIFYNTLTFFLKEAISQNFAINYFV